MYEKVGWTTKPPYFHDLHYDADLPLSEKAFSHRNILFDYLPDVRNWIYDQIERYAATKLRNKSRIIEAESICKTLRWYDRTVINVDPFTTVVTQLYICELLSTLLIAFFDTDPTPRGHGYSWPRPSVPTIETSLKSKGDGLAFALHRVFYHDPLKPNNLGEFQPLYEYLKFLPEIRMEYETLGFGPSLVISCDEGYSATGAHQSTENETYHYVIVGDDSLLNLHHGMLSVPALFPELANFYTVGGRFSAIPVSRLLKSDQMISTTYDMKDEIYAFGFGKSPVQKLRDIEVRFYIMFVLGSLGRYNPEIWSNLPEEQPTLYYFVRRFLEHNQIMYPLLVLRYMTGRAFILGNRGRFG